MKKTLVGVAKDTMLEVLKKGPMDRLDLILSMVGEVSVNGCTLTGSGARIALNELEAEGKVYTGPGNIVTVVE